MSNPIILRGFLASFLLCCSFTVNAERYTIPLLVPASVTGDPQGVVRILNDAQESATVTIHAIDDAGVRTGPATVVVDALSAVQLSATELQSGNAAKGLSAGLGSLSGEARLVIDSGVPVVPSAYVRNADGTLSAMNATVLEAAGAGQDAYRYDVAVFLPAGNATQPSRLRLINPGEAPARVTITARDDTGAAATGGTVELTLPAGGARTLSAQQLEAGDNAVLTGRLGAGVGNWRLSVTSDRPIRAVNVAETPGTGRWNNLSTTAVSGWAPESAAAFEARFLGRTTVSRDGQNRTTFQVLADNGFLHTYMDDGVEIRQEGRYRYERTGRDAGLLRLDYDADVSCEARFYFGSRISGWYAFACVDREDRVEVWTGNTWLSLDSEAMPLDLGSGPDDRVYTAGTAIETLTLAAASGGDGEFTYSLSPEVPGLRFDPATRDLTGTPSEAGVYLMTYRVRDASGDTDWRYFNIAVQAAGGETTTFGVGDTLSDLPTGSWTPDVTSNGTFLLSGGIATVNLDRGGYIEEGDYRYTCQSTGGCTIEDGRVLSGTIAQSTKGTAPGSGTGGGDDHGDDRASATRVEAESDTPGVLTAGDVDYFRVDVSGSGTLEVRTTGGTDTYGYLEDAGGETLRSNDNGGAGTNFRIAEDVSAGTYFVRVRGYSSRTTGEYTLHVRFTESNTGTTPPGGGQETTFGVGDTLSGLPMGTWAPNVSGGGTLLISGSGVTLRLNDASYFEHDGHRYTCRSATGCVIENRRVTSGTVVQTAAGTAPGGGGTGTDAQPSFAAGSGPGNQTYTVGTAINALTLPEASGGDGPLTYSLSPEVPGLIFNATSTVRRLTGTPTSAGTYNLTYRVRDTDGDTDLFTFTVTVEEPTGSSVGERFGLGDSTFMTDIVYADGRFYVVNRNNRKVYVYTDSGARDASADFDLDAANRRAGGLAHADGRFYVVDSADDKVYVYTASGVRDASADFDLHDDNGSPQGITHVNGRFYVVDSFDDKVYAYTDSGAHDTSADFGLHDDNGWPRGITHVNDRLYVVNDDGTGIANTKVYAYTASGARDASADFDLPSVNDSPWGIAYANGRFRVVDWWADKVFAYTDSGARDASTEFVLGTANSEPRDIAHTNGRFYVVDDDRKVYAYTAMGTRDVSADFVLHDANDSPQGIVHVNGRLYVVDRVDDKAYAYTETGAHDASADFDLQDANGSPQGITHANGRFYVVDDFDRKVYAYTDTGAHDASVDFDLHDANGSPQGITYANGRFYVVDEFDRKVYAYTDTGARVASFDFDVRGDGPYGGTGRGIASTNGRLCVVYIAYIHTDHVICHPTPTGDTVPEPDLVVESVSVNDSSPSARASFMFSATVRNRGDGQSGSTTLRYYRSSNATISGSDTQVGTDSVIGLSASDTSEESISLTAPSSAGTYYYGACVDSVTGESNTDNNCSSAVRIAVTGNGDESTPPAPGNLRVTRTGDNIRVSWDRSPGADYYEVWRCNDSIFNCNLPASWSRRATVTGTSWLDTNLPTPAPGISVRLRYVVQACNSAGCSGQLE